LRKSGGSKVVHLIYLLKCLNIKKKVSKQTQYNIILRYTQLSKYAMTIAQNPDSTGYPLNVQT